MDVIIFALARWDGPYSSTTFSLAKEFSKNHRVFYVENPLTLKYVIRNAFTPEVRKRILPLFFGKRRYKRLDIPNSELTVVTPPVTLPVNFLPKGKLYNLLSAVNDLLVGRVLTGLIKDYAMREYLFIDVFNPFYARRIPRLFKPKLFVYITVDDIANSKHISKHGPYLEAEMARKADVVFCTSRELKAIMGKMTRHVHLLPNAADVELFKTGQTQPPNRPHDITSVKEPIVVYTGHIDHRLDTDLLEYLLQSCPDYHFLMIGPVSLASALVAKLKSYPNTLFIGKKLLTELPTYLSYAECAIIPFKCNTLTRSIYPLKINEYLAAGKPVVSTAFSEDIQDFDEVIHLANSADEFAGNIKYIIENNLSRNEGLVNKRIGFVEKNTWEERANLFWQISSSYLKPKQA